MLFNLSVAKDSYTHDTSLWTIFIHTWQKMYLRLRSISSSRWALDWIETECTDKITLPKEQRENFIMRPCILVWIAWCEPDTYWSSLPLPPLDCVHTVVFVSESEWQLFTPVARLMTAQENTVKQLDTFVYLPHDCTLNFNKFSLVFKVPHTERKLHLLATNAMAQKKRIEATPAEY